jgi:hypothetical protein
MEYRNIIEKAATKTNTIGIENFDFNPSFMGTPYITNSV